MRLALPLVCFAISCGGTAAPPAPVTKPPAPEAVTGPVIPDSPAGGTLRAWLDAFNSGDDAQLRAFVERYHPSEPAEQWLAFRAQTGGFELLDVEATDRLALRFVVKEKASPTEAVGWLRVVDADPAAVELFELLAIPPGVDADDMEIRVDAATRGRVVEAAAAALIDLYVYPEVAERMAQAIREHAARGAYDAVDVGPELAKLLTEHLRAVSHDLHLNVMFMPWVVPADPGEPSAEQQAQMREQLVKNRCGFHPTERLDGNIGYLRFDMFGDAETCGRFATEAFATLGEVDALIVDLRDNGGGQPEMVAYVTSYLFDTRTHLNDIYYRPEDRTEEHWTDPGVPGDKLAEQPVYVLTSAGTFSGAEEFAYNLQALGRATIVGETTGGGAHPTMGKRIDDHFVIGVPSARAINPITRTNWEGTGVVPDVKVSRAEALETARTLAAERIAELKKPPAKKKRKKK
jgi:hypothetical protein